MNHNQIDSLDFDQISISTQTYIRVLRTAFSSRAKLEYHLVLYSITITLRQVLGWIFLHEQFIGNKIIAHILALSSLLFLAHNDAFRFNLFLLGLAMITSAVAMKTIFDILIVAFIKDFSSSKLRIVMINVCFCGTCLLWPFVLFFHLTHFEPIHSEQFNSYITILTLICALPLAPSLLLVIPLISTVDYYLLNVKYSPLVISSIICSFAAVILTMIPKECFQGGEGSNMKQALGLINKDSTSNANMGLLNTTATTTGTSSAFEEIRTQRRIRNALLYNEMKT